MEFTPKADCTSAVVMFLRNMGYKHGVHYKGWPHEFREHFIYKHCGMSNWCMFFDPKWFRFKVVRNPYERAVSSYLHCMSAQLLPDYFTNDDYDYVTFRDFILFLTTIPQETIQDIAFGHAGYQSSKFEREYFEAHNKSIFHAIVKAENPDEALARINQEKHTHFRLGYNSSHFVRRHSETCKFVGDVEYAQIKDVIPASYQYFYDKALKLLVEKIYEVDLKMYGYSYPYDEAELR